MMTGEKKLDQSKEVTATGLKSASLANSAEKDVASGKLNPSDSASSISSSGDATSGLKGETDKGPVAEQDVYYPPTSCYGYYYPGYDGAYPEWNDNGYFHAGDGSEIPYSGPAASSKSKGLNSVKTNGTVDNKVYAMPFDSKSRLSTASSNFSKSTLQSQAFKPLNKVPQLGSDFRSAGLIKGCYPVRKFSSLTNQGQGFFPQNGPMSYRPNGQTWAGNDRFKSGEKFNRNGQFEAPNELNRGPRAHRGRTPLSSSAEKDQLGLTVRRDQYNLQDFQTEYKNAKFFVIKSYSEDDIHKSIKYDVWASTPTGNNKLDAAFHDAETRSSETGTRSPIFLFYSVNGSGQFVGLAEMIGKVDFKKDMDFWQQDKWNGFFPVKWHIIKDIPNSQLRHIILENNDNKSVTNSRDTQEIGFKQGSEMLTIFKSYPAKTLMLDDFNYYEDREKSLHARRSSKTASPEIEIFSNEFPQKRLEAGVRKAGEVSTRAKRTSDPKTSLITLTKNLSLNSRLPKTSAGKDSAKE